MQWLLVAVVRVDQVTAVAVAQVHSSILLTHIYRQLHTVLLWGMVVLLRR